jgi:hypothetical protein
VAIKHLTYPLQNGFVGNWLVAGPQAIPVDLGNLGAVEPCPTDGVQQIVRRYWEEDTGISGMPVERGPLGAGVVHAGAYTGVWAYYACPADHFVDHSGTYPRCHYLRSWAYVEIVSKTRQLVALELTAHGPTGVWVDGAAVFQTDDAGDGPTTHAFCIELDKRATPILVRFDRVAVRETAHAMALRICCAGPVADAVRVPAAGIHVRLRSLISDLGRRNAFERLTAGVYLERDVYQGETPIVLRWPEGQRAFCPAHVRLQGPDDSIYALADAAGESGDALHLGFAMQLPACPLRVTLMPSPDEVYLKNVRIEHHVPLWSMGPQRFSTVAPPDLTARRGEALLAVAQYADSPFAQIARMALGAWDDVEIGVLRQATEMVRCRADRSNVVLVGLLGMLDRWGDHAQFPAEIRQPLEDAVLSYRYGEDEPADDLMEYRSESSRILFYAGEVLAGQRYPEHTFADGRTGAWHRVRGERLALEWLTLFGSVGSAEWGSSDAMAHELVALSHLSDLAQDTQVYELAAVCTDKLLFTLALNSRQGVLGAACRSGRPSFVKSGYLQPTVGISRLLWGTGIYNHHLAGVLSLACASGYDPPPVLEAIARDAPAALWSRERHAAAGHEPTELATYKTPEYILSSVQSIPPGRPGACELVWRVTLGPEAVVFANHPGSSSESDSRVPGFWAGNARLPRVAQWQDVVVSIHHLPADDVFGFTHAYFPSATFDEYVLRDGWAFGRVGDGYVALGNSQGVRMTVEGRYAMRELKAWGSEQTWLVQMGRAALDGDFAEFQEKVLALPVSLTGESARCTTLRGDVLTLSGNGPLRVNGEAQPTRAAMHFDNAYTTTELPCTQMEIRHGDDYLRLDFSAVDRVSS